MDDIELKIKKGTQVSVEKIKNIYKKLNWSIDLVDETVNDINDFLANKFSFWAFMTEKKDIYFVTFSRTTSGLSYLIQ